MTTASAAVVAYLLWVAFCIVLLILLLLKGTR